MFVGYTKYYEGGWYNMIHPMIRTIYQSRDVTWSKRIYYHNELDEDHKYLFPLPQEDDNKNYEQDNDSKVYIAYTDGNESDIEDKIMS